MTSADNPPGEACRACYFWRGGDPRQAEVRDCRRFPPRMGKTGAPVWPRTPAGAWCGEWQRAMEQ